jgi:hypothetical protein
LTQLHISVLPKSELTQTQTDEYCLKLFYNTLHHLHQKCLIKMIIIENVYGAKAGVEELDHLFSSSRVAKRKIEKA